MSTAPPRAVPAASARSTLWQAATACSARAATDDSTTTRFPMGKTLDDAQPVVETVPGWHCDITGVRKFEDLPKAAQDYVKRLEELVGCKIKYISVGPERDACIVRK